MTNIMVAGAAGTLGSRIVEELVKRGAHVRALARPAGRRPYGVEVVERALTDPALAEAMDGVDVVVSALQGGPDVIVDGQAALLRAAEKASVPRFVPSDFAVDLFLLDDGDNAFLDHRRQAHRAFAGTPVAVTSVLNGAFAEVVADPFLEIVDWARGTFTYWGDGDQPVDLTTIADTAAYTAAAVLDGSTAGPVRVAGDVLTMKQIHAALEQGTGRRLELRKLGDVDELAAEIHRRRAVATAPTDYVALQYVWAMVSGKAKLHPLDNDRYPDIRPTSFLRYVSAHEFG